MPDLARLAAQIELAAAHVTPYWPLRSFIAASPLQGLEDRPFEDAARTAGALFGGRAWPAPRVFRAALADGRIDPGILAGIAAAQGQPEATRFDALEPEGPPKRPAAPSAVNRVLIRYLAAFLDEGQAAWPMPGREKGLWGAARALLRHDPEVPRGAEAQALPEDAMRALQALLEGVAEAERPVVLTRHLAALSGWAGHVRWRARERGHPWAAAAPARLADLLALRLFLARQFGEAPSCCAPPEAPEATAIWLEAWEETWRRRLTRALRAATPVKAQQPEAQLVFCIDVRSEVLRRHLERQGPWETLGFAGFFAAAVSVQAFGAKRPYASCPVLLEPRQVVPEVAAEGADPAPRLRGLARLARAKDTLRGMKESIAGAFGFVEAGGAAFGAAMLGRTLAPRGFARAAAGLERAAAPAVPTRPRIGLACDDATGAATGLSPAEQLGSAEAALRIMGLTKDFAKLVVLVGHGGSATNNPFAAGLDCGACGGHRGGPNARIMATVLNEPGIRAGLAARGIAIPAETVFLAAEHDTTTDAVTIYDEATAGAQSALLARLKTALDAARDAAVAERLPRLPGRGQGVAAAERRGADWAETRPEWALARNAAFIVAGRDFTRHLDLEGRCFLHSYDWEADRDGGALEVILTAPMVVAQWINAQYYFSTVDNAVFGAGSKVTHTVTGGFGVMQGNGSDLMTGLPAQSVLAEDGTPFHEPLRLMTVVRAPLARVEGVIARHAVLQRLFGNGWVALLVADPETGRFLRRGRDGVWRPAEDGTGDRVKHTEEEMAA